MDLSQFSNLDSVTKAFPSQAVCVAYCTEPRWKGNVTCPYCNFTKVCAMKGATKRYKCGNAGVKSEGRCARLFSVCVRTIVENKLLLKVWFTAI